MGVSTRATAPQRGVANARFYTPERILSSSIFSDANSLYEDAKHAILSGISHQELVYTKTPKDWAETVLDKLDNEIESGSGRKHFNSSTGTLWIRTMPTELHDCHQVWFSNEKTDWALPRADSRHLKVKVGTTIKFIRGPYRGSRKEPDLLLRPDNLEFPTFVIESGWSESYSRLLDDMNLWLVGGDGKTEAVLIIKWQYVSNTFTVKGHLELYTRDNQTMPRLQQTEVIFPAPSPPQAALQRVRLTRKMLWGETIVPGTNPGDVFPLWIDSLRESASHDLALMGLVPA